MISTWRKTGLAGIALALSLVLTGCIKLDMNLELEGGTASGEMVVAVSEDLLEMTGGDASDVFEGTLPEGTTAEPYEEDGYVGQRHILENIELSEFDDPEMSITYDEAAGTYEVDGAMDFTADDTGQLPSGMGESLSNSFDVSISISFPGEVIEHNGELDGNTVTWQPSADEVTELRAVADENGSSGGSAWLWVALAALGVLIVVALVVVLGRRRGDSADSASEGAAQEGAAQDGADESGLAPDAGEPEAATPEERHT